MRLPDSAGLRPQLGVVPCGHQHGAHQSYPEARVSGLYDVLNPPALDAQLKASSRAEHMRELARHAEAIWRGNGLTRLKGCGLSASGGWPWRR